MDKRDAVLAKLAMALGLIDDAGLQRAMALRARFAEQSFDQVLLQSKLIDQSGWRRLVEAFNARKRGSQPAQGAGRDAGERPTRVARSSPQGRPAAGGPPPRAPGPAPGAPPEDELEIPSDDDEDALEVPPDEPEPQDPQRVVIPVEDDDGLRSESSDELDALFDEPTLVVQPEEPAAEQDEDAILAEPTMVVDEAQAQGSGGEGSAPDGPDEDAILAEPTMIVDDDSGSGRAPGPTEQDEEAILAEPTMIVDDGSGPGQTSAGSDELAIDTSLAGSGRRKQPTGPTPGVRAKPTGGPLDRDEFQRRLKMRLPFEGFSLGDYKIKGDLSRGAFGMVLEVEPDGVAKSLARERGYSGNLALKVMLENTSDPRETERFLDEVRVLIGFDHPHIVRIFDAGVDNGLTYYSMELVQGIEARSHVLKKGPMPPLLVVRVIKEVASALGYVHAQRIYHRDLKPQNVMLDQSTQPYRSLLIDFGLVQENQDERDKGLVMGTPSYMPPEQAQPRGGHGEVNATSDLYALGATMYFLLTGKPPFAGKDPRKIIKMVLEKAPKDPVEHNAQVPRRVADVCLKLLEKRQRDRYHSALKLEQDLEKELRSGRRKLKAKSILGRFLGKPKR